MKYRVSDVSMSLDTCLVVPKLADRLRRSKAIEWPAASEAKTSVCPTREPFQKNKVFDKLVRN